MLLLVLKFYQKGVMTVIFKMMYMFLPDEGKHLYSYSSMLFIALYFLQSALSLLHSLEYWSSVHMLLFHHTSR